MKNEEERHISRNDAKSIVDTLFDTKIFKDDLTRDDMNAIEDLIDYLMNSRIKSILQARAIFDKLKK